jgi:hypothetical protein
MNTLTSQIDLETPMPDLYGLKDHDFVSQETFGDQDAEDEIVLLVQHEVDIKDLVEVVPMLKQLMYENGQLKKIYHDFIQIEHDLGSTAVANAIVDILLNTFKVADLGIKITLLKVRLAARSLIDPIRITEKSVRESLDYTNHKEVLDSYRYIHERTVKIIREKVINSNMWIDVHTMSPNSPDKESFSEGGGAGFYFESPNEKDLKKYIDLYTSLDGVSRPDINFIVGFDSETLLSQERDIHEIEANPILYQKVRTFTKQEGYTIGHNAPYYLHEGHEIARYMADNNVGIVADISKKALVRDPSKFDLIDPDFSDKKNIYRMAYPFAEAFYSYLQKHATG